MNIPWSIWRAKKSGATDEHTAIMNTWDSFSGATTKNWRNLPLTYWLTSNSESTVTSFTAPLLAYLDGGCGDWSQLLIRTFSVHKAIILNNPEESKIEPDHPTPIPDFVFVGCTGFNVFPTLKG